jgi:predicted nucleotidyltransferase
MGGRADDEIALRFPELAPLPAGYRALFRRAVEIYERDARVRALWLSGSVARGTADVASDLDLLVAIRDEDLPAFAADWASLLREITPTVIARPLSFLPGSFYSVTPARERFDVVVESVGGLARTFFRSRLLVFDKDGIAGSVPPAVAGPGPSRERIAQLVEEFWRDFGMMDVFVARGDVLLGIEGVHVLRGLLYQLFCEDDAPAASGGTKQWSARLRAAQRDVLEALPTGGRSIAEVIAASEAVGRAFVRDARAICARHGVAWPDDLDAATRRHLRAHGLPSLDGV